MNHFPIGLWARSSLLDCDSPKAHRTRILGTFSRSGDILLMQPPQFCMWAQHLLRCMVSKTVTGSSLESYLSQGVGPCCGNYAAHDPTWYPVEPSGESHCCQLPAFCTGCCLELHVYIFHSKCSLMIHTISLRSASYQVITFYIWAWKFEIHLAWCWPVMSSLSTMAIYDSKLAVGRVLSHSSFILMASFSLWPSVCDGRLYRVYVQWLILVWLVCHLGECTVLYLDLVNWLHVSEIFWDCFATVALVTLQSILLSPISNVIEASFTYTALVTFTMY